MRGLDQLGLPLRWGLIALGAIGAALVMAVATVPNLVTGWVAVVLVVLALALIPSARSLSGRLFTNCVLVAALVYLGWMIPSPPVLAQGERLLVGLAAVCGGMIAARVVGLLRVRLLPEVRFIDLSVLVMVPLAAANTLQLWFSKRSLDGAYGTLAAFWDNSSHYYIVSSMHQWQSITRWHPAPPDGSANGFIDYPVGYHSNAATMLDLLVGDPGRNPGPHQMGFLVVAGAMAVFGYLVVAAGVAALRSVREAGVLGPFAVGATLSLFGFGPGFLPQANSQYNFFFAVVMVLAAVIAAVSLDRVFDPVPAATLLAAILLAGGAWLPLGLLAAVLAAVCFWPLGRERWQASWVERGIVAGLAVLVVVFTIIPLSWLTSTFTTEVFATATGGVSPVTAFLPMLGVIALLAIVIARVNLRSRFADDAQPTRLIAAGVGLVVAIIGYVIIESINLANHDAELPTYYPQKLFNSFAILLLAVTAILAAPVGARLLGRLEPGVPVRGVLAGLLAAALGLGSFWVGQLPVLGRGGIGAEYVNLEELPEPREDLRVACRVAAELPPEQVGIVATGFATDTLICAADRYLYTSHAWQVNADTMERWDEDLVAAAMPYLREGSAVLIVDPFVLDFYRAEVGPEYVDQVIAWEWDR